jgi:8-oxo-dGTP diphosphatase
MVLAAHQYLREKTLTERLSFEMLPEKFTRSQLHTLYEAIFGTKLEIRNFAKKIERLHVLRRLNEKSWGSSGRKAHYFVLEKNKKSAREKEGIRFL